MGGMFSILATLAVPERVERLVTLGGSARCLSDDGYRGGFSQPALVTFFDAIRLDDLAWASGFARQAMSNPDRPELGDSVFTSMKQVRPDIALSVLRVVMQADLRDRLDELKQAVSLTQTKGDIVPIEAAEYLHGSVENGEPAVIDATGHLPHISAAAEVIGAMKVWLRNGSAA